MNRRAAIFCHNGLGDGVNSLVLANNLHLNGWHVDTYHNAIGSMRNWFPHLEVKSYPLMEDLGRTLSAYDAYFAIHNDTDPFVQALILEGKRRFPEKIKVLYLYPSRHIINEPYYSDCWIDPKLPVAENMRLFCEKVLHLPKITRSNGFIAPVGLVHRKETKRVIIHPTSARETRNWPKEKFVKLALHLKGEGYRVVFVPGGEKECEQWQDVLELGLEVIRFATLDLLARYLYESGYLIGNDSGLGHLASALGLPTVTICRRKTLARMWAPSLHLGAIVTPWTWIPNLRGLRLRDRYWKRFITVEMVRRRFGRLVRESVPAMR